MKYIFLIMSLLLASCVSHEHYPVTPQNVQENLVKDSIFRAKSLVEGNLVLIRTNKPQFYKSGDTVWVARRTMRIINANWSGKTTSKDFFKVTIQ